MAEIERLQEQLRFPLPQGNEIDWPYMRQVIGILEKELGQKTNTTVNLLLDRAGNTTILYLGVPNEAGTYPNGTWRINASSATEYLVQLLVAGTWVTKSVLTSDKLLKTGSIGLQSVSVTAAYSVADGIYSVYADGASPFNITLPTLTGQRSIRCYIAEGSSDITAVGTINEESNLVMCAGETWDFVDNTTTWTV